MSILFFTSANKKYEPFVPLYLYFALSNNENSFAEILLENAEQYEQENARLIKRLDVLFPDRFKLTTVNFKGVLPSAVRFINEPTFGTHCDHVYIGDIDILILDTDVEDQHTANMSKYGSSFSNIVRKTKLPRLSGLHFSPLKTHYPLPDLADLDYSLSNKKRGADENILYEIVKRKELKHVQNLKFRPEHGIHISLNRHPLGYNTSLKELNSEIKTGKFVIYWTGIETDLYRQRYLSMTRCAEFESIFFLLQIQSKNIHLIIENICLNNFQDFSKFFEVILMKRNKSFTRLKRSIRKLF